MNTNKIKKLTQRQEGFTIIEVMIVLVIAAVILLIVFLAVPALQRNSRNTQRKNEVASMLAGANEFETNNNGSVPGAWAVATATNPGQFQKDAATATGAVPVKLSFYDGTSATAVTVGPGSTAANLVAVGNVANIRIVSGAVCAATAGTATTTNASSRQLVALYTVESTGAGTDTCQAG
jgi:prepilin-type N-terminal cleavage/methylation domain-containing protein